MKTAAIMELVELFLGGLSTSTVIEKWCLDKYQKTPWFISGMDYNKPPREEECPYIVIMPNEKLEGHVAELRYGIIIAWCICNKETENKNNVTKFKGLYESDELGQLILKEAATVLKN